MRATGVKAVLAFFALELAETRAYHQEFLVHTLFGVTELNSHQLCTSALLSQLIAPQ